MTLALMVAVTGSPRSEAMAGSLIPYDPVIEEAMDAALRARDLEGPPAYNAALLALEKSTPQGAAIGSRIRLDSYLMYLHIELGQPERAKQFNDHVLHLAASSGYADAWVVGLVGSWVLQPEDTPRDIQLQTIVRMLGYLEIAQSPRVKYVGYFTVANAFSGFGDREAALGYFQTALGVVQSDDVYRNDFRRLALKLQISQLHGELGNWPLALELADEALETAISLQYHRHVPDLNLLKGRALANLGRNDAAEAAFEEGLHWATKRHDDSMVANLLNALGEMHLEAGRLDAARISFGKALVAAQQTGEGTAGVDFNVGRMLAKSGQLGAGIERMVKAISVFREGNDLVQVEKLLGKLADVYREAGRFNQEAQTLRERMALSAELFQEKCDARISELQARFVAKERIAAIARLTQENQLKQSELTGRRLQQRFTLLLVAVTVLGSGLLYVLYRKIRIANRLLLKNNDQLAFQSTHDELTGLLNRRSCLEQMGLEKARRRAGDPGVSLANGIIVLDIDHFKQINDSRGHAAGDLVLVEVARRLVQASRANDLVVRWGGEEFLLVIRGIEFSALTSLCRRILQGIGGTPIPINGAEVNVTLSAGFLSMPFGDGELMVVDFESLLGLADVALYKSKSDGRNRAYGLHSPMGEIGLAHGRFDFDLVGAIEAGLVSSVLVQGPNASGSHVVGNAKPDDVAE